MLRFNQRPQFNEVTNRVRSRTFFLQALPTFWENANFKDFKAFFKLETRFIFFIQHLKNKLKAYRGPVLWSVDFHLFASPMFQLGLQGPDAGRSLVKFVF